MNFEDFFVKKVQALPVGWNLSLLPWEMLQLWKTLGKNVRHFHENKQTRHKWGGLFSKIRELMRNVLSNEKDAIEVRHNHNFGIYLDFCKFRAINEFWRVFSQESVGSAGWVKFVTAALGNAAIMENIG